MVLPNYVSFQFESFVKLMRGQNISKEMWGDPRYTEQEPPPPPPLINDDDGDGCEEYKGGK